MCCAADNTRKSVIVGDGRQSSLVDDICQLSHHHWRDVTQFVGIAGVLSVEQHGVLSTIVIGQLQHDSLRPLLAAT